MARLDAPGYQVCAECGDHGAVVGTQLGPRYPQGDAVPCAALFGERAQPGVGRDAAADDQRPDAELAAGLNGFGGEDVAHRLEWHRAIWDVELALATSLVKGDVTAVEMGWNLLLWDKE